MFSVESVNQGKHFDAPESVAQIPHFIKAYKLDLSELLLPNVDQYHSFNQFFYRKLRPDTRPIHEVDNPVSINQERESARAICLFVASGPITKPHNLVCLLNL